MYDRKVVSTEACPIISATMATGRPIAYASEPAPLRRE